MRRPSIATLGGTPAGTPGAVVQQRTWDDYGLGRASVIVHLAALDVVYTGVIESHRHAQRRLADPDPISEDMVIGQLRRLELFQWLVRAHLEMAEGELRVEADTIRGAARQAAALS